AEDLGDRRDDRPPVRPRTDLEQQPHEQDEGGGPDRADCGALRVQPHTRGCSGQHADFSCCWKPRIDSACSEDQIRLWTSLNSCVETMEASRSSGRSSSMTSMIVPGR